MWFLTTILTMYFPLSVKTDYLPSEIFIVKQLLLQKFEKKKYEF